MNRTLLVALLAAANIPSAGAQGNYQPLMRGQVARISSDSPRTT